MENNNKEMLTIKEAAETYNIGRDTMYDLCLRYGKNNFVFMVGRKRLIKKDKFDKWLNEAIDNGFSA